MKNIESKKKRIDALRRTLEFNDKVLDYIKDYNRRLEDEMKIPYENDELRLATEEDLEVHKYIEICLKYLGEQYTIALRRFG